mmetsp:Transcript_26174/g.68320  ORF Transcript_26174/g.68320 Transcript_26174/m.68320 type:complete len:224 (+) Transcript_26174:146-817(+)
MCRSHCSRFSSLPWKWMVPPFWSMKPPSRLSAIILAAIFSARSGGTSSSCPRSSSRMFLYTRDAASTLCCSTALSSTVCPSASRAFWCGTSDCSNFWISLPRISRSKNILCRISWCSTLLMRSSLQSSARIRERCGPAGARMAHVTALFRSMRRSSSCTWPFRVCCDRSQYFDAASRNFRLLSMMRAWQTLNRRFSGTSSTSCITIAARAQKVSAATGSSSSR